MGMKEIRDFRDFAFPRALSDKNSTPYLALINANEWADPDAVNAVNSFLSASEKLNQEHSESNSLWERYDPPVLAEYLEWLLPERLLIRQSLDLENLDIWFLDAPFKVFLSLRQSDHLTKSAPTAAANHLQFTTLVKTEPKTEKELRPLSLRKRKAAPQEHDIIELSDDGDAGLVATVPTTRVSKKLKREGTAARQVVPSVIDLTSDIDDDQDVKPPLLNSTAPAKPNKKAKLRCKYNFGDTAKIKITSSEYVAEVVQLTEIPTHWNPSKAPKAYVIDLSENKVILENGKKNIMGLIRGDDQCSWSGSSGYAKGDVKVHGIFLGEETTLCQRAQFKCQSIKICEFFDQDRFVGYESYDMDSDDMEEFWAGELKANEDESRIPDGPEARFYNRVQASKCKMNDCTGKPRLVDLMYATRYGKATRVGCSAWRPGDPKGSHRWIDLDQDVDEVVFNALFKSGGRFKENTTINGQCSLIVPFRSHKKTCPYSHIIDGEIKQGKIVPHKEPCDSMLLIFQPVDSKLSHMAVVIPKHPHNHPRHAHVKPTLAEKVFVSQAFKAAGKTRVTPKALQLSATTNALLGGQSWESRLPGLTDKKRLRKHIDSEKEKEYPAGLEWNGVQHEANREAGLPPDERYIHSIITRGELQLVVTMLPQLVKRIHSVRFLAIDYTFKRVRGKMNEWEVASFVDRFNTRVSFASLYCNKATREAFSLLFSEFFYAVRRVTGQPLKLAAFTRDDTKLHALLFDGEAAQMQGCGDVMLTMNDAAISGINTKDPLLLVQYVAKTCILHFNRNIDKLPRDVPRDVINRLKAFPGLSTQQDIEVWHEFCRTSPHKGVRDWHQQKMDHLWYLPSLNPFLSPMDSKSWKLTPNDTNIAETAHAARNAETGINSALLTAILNARTRDEAIAKRFEESERTPGIVGSRWNSATARGGHSSSRRVAGIARAVAVHDSRDHLRMLEEELAKLADKRAKSLEEKRKMEQQVTEVVAKLKTQTKISMVAEGLRHERDTTKAQIKDGVDQRKIWSARATELETKIKKLKSNELKGVRARDSRPPSTPRRDNLPAASLLSTPKTPSHMSSNSTGKLNPTPLRKRHLSEEIRGHESDMDADGEDDMEIDVNPLHFSPPYSPRLWGNDSDGLAQVNGEGVAVMSDVGLGMLDDREFINGLLSWQPTDEESNELQNHFLQLFPDGNYQLFD